MQNFTITKEYSFDAAHRLVDGYHGKCAHLHGHTWKVRISLWADGLDKMGMVRDFNSLKPLKDWIDEFLDHGTLVNTNDTPLRAFLEKEKNKAYPIQGNPTSENVAKLIASVCIDVLDLPVSAVEIDETCTSTARYEP